MDNDLGADGPAALARTRREIVWQRRVTAVRSVSERRLVYVDAIQIDAMHNAALIDDRQWQAGYRLYRMYCAAGLSARVTARVDVVADEPAEDVGESSEDAPEDPRVAYRRLLRDMGDRDGCLLDSLMAGSLPAWRAGVAGRALTRLADFWGMG